MEQNRTKSAVAVADRSPEPLFALSGRTVRSDRFWRWGDDNMLPYALSLMSRRSTTHRRIINDKADYIAGKGFSFDERLPLLGRMAGRINGDGESLRTVLSRLAFDKSLMGNAFLEAVTDGKRSFLSLYHQDASRCRIARDGRHVMLHHDWSAFKPDEARNEGDWSALHEQATSDIVIAHSWFRSLSGLDYSSGFSSERILHEYEVALNTVILAEQEELMEPIKCLMGEVTGIDASSLEIVNRPPTRSKPIYMKVWEARKADGLEFDPDDERQQPYLSQITKYNITRID